MIATGLKIWWAKKKRKGIKYLNMTLWSVNALVISISFMAYMIDLEVAP